MKRRSLNDFERLVMLAYQSGLCAICRDKLAPRGYHGDHSTPVALGNDAKPDQLICIPCHKDKTRKDVKAIAKAKRLHRTFIEGIKPKRKTIQSRGFDRKWRKRMDGSVVPRQMEERA